MAGKTNDSLDKLHNEVPAAQPSGRALFASHWPRWLTSLNPVVGISILFILLGPASHRGGLALYPGYPWARRGYTPGLSQ